MHTTINAQGCRVPTGRTRRAIVVASSMVFGLALTGLSVARAYAGSKTATVEFGTVESVARAANGDTVEINGEGSFTLQPKSAGGDAPTITAAFGSVPRTFTHRTATGTVLASGTWEPTAVLSYRSFGPATEEQSAEFGGLPPGTEGGKMLLQVALYVGGVHVHDGIVTIVCLLGTPPKNADESTLLLVQGTEFNFHTALRGDNVFIRD
jgi:hypothetical protein